MDYISDLLGAYWLALLEAGKCVLSHRLVVGVLAELVNHVLLEVMEAVQVVEDILVEVDADLLDVLHVLLELPRHEFCHGLRLHLDQGFAVARVLQVERPQKTVLLLPIGADHIDFGV